MDDMTGTNWVSFGSSGSGSGQFTGCSRITLDVENRIYVTDQNNGRLIRLGNMYGSGWTQFGTQGSGVNQFNAPVGLLIQ